MKYLFGIQPTGKLHIGNYLGGLKKALELQEDNEVEFLIANYHALTKKDTTETLKASIDLRKALKMLGAKNITTQTAENTGLAWKIMCKTPVTELERMIQWKEKGKGNAGLLTYPCLMAADIILSEASVVITGEDQTQHMEFYKKACSRLNYYPAEQLVTETPRIMSLSNPENKMSKSEPRGCLYLFDKGSDKNIMKAVTNEAGRKNLETICLGLGGEIKESNKELKEEIIKVYKCQ
jgi:tryptophanyl-tRNA synthetase